MSELRMTGLTFRGHPVCFFEDTGGPTLPTDMDFVYLAKNFDGTKVVNAAETDHCSRGRGYQGLSDEPVGITTY